MEPEVIALRDRRIEQAIIDISKKVSDAMGMLQGAKETIARSESLLIEAQLGLEELFVGLKEDVDDRE